MEVLRFLGQLVIAIAVYIVFFLVMAVIAFASVGFDLEGEGDAYLRYYVVFGLAYGAAVRWWWVLPFPALQLYVVRPGWHDLTSEGDLDYAYDRGAAVVALTVGIACGLAARELYRRRSQPAAS